MTPLPSPIPQYLVSLTEAEADAGRRYIAESLRTPIAGPLREYETAAVACFAKLSGVLDAAKEGRKKQEGGNVG